MIVMIVGDLTFKKDHAYNICMDFNVSLHSCPFEICCKERPSGAFQLHCGALWWPDLNLL